jgi:signal transduction histidine kinase
MRVNSQPPSPLLRLLRVLEWVLLGIVALVQLLVALNSGMPIGLIPNALGLGLFAILGWVTPQRKFTKLIYTTIEFGLIFGLAFYGNLPLPTMLFVVLVIRNCVLLESRSQRIVTAMSFCGCLISQTHRLIHQNIPVKVSLDQLSTVWFGMFTLLALVILFLHLLVNVALKESQAQAQLAAANARLREYALRIEELATEQERNRIARDIHDSLGHSLTVFSIHLEAASRLLHTNPTKAETLLLEAKRLNAKTLQEVRQALTTLRTNPLQALTLPSAIANLATEFQNATEVIPTVSIHLESAVSKEHNMVIYRIVQESLTNICKYAKATEVSIAIQQSAQALQVTIQDNGQGFEPSQNTTGFGLQGMQERTLALGGQMEIQSAPDQGCRVDVVFPLSANPVSVLGYPAGSKLRASTQPTKVDLT